jgi:hypothetical protein
MNLRGGHAIAAVTSQPAALPPRSHRRAHLDQASTAHPGQRSRSRRVWVQIGQGRINFTDHDLPLNLVDRAHQVCLGDRRRLDVAMGDAPRASRSSG